MNGHPAPAGLWQDRAACAGQDPDWWDPEVATSGEMAAALTACAACPVKVDCLRAAMASEGGNSAHNRATIRGGYTPEERAHVYRRWSAARKSAAGRQEAAA